MIVWVRVPPGVQKLNKMVIGNRPVNSFLENTIGLPESKDEGKVGEYVNEKLHYTRGKYVFIDGMWWWIDIQ